MSSSGRDRRPAGGPATQRRRNPGDQGQGDLPPLRPPSARRTTSFPAESRAPNSTLSRRWPSAPRWSPAPRAASAASPGALPIAPAWADWPRRRRASGAGEGPEPPGPRHPCRRRRPRDLHPGRDAVIAAGEAAGIDLLVNNAGLGYFAPVPRNSIAQERAMVEVNVTTPVVLTRALLPGCSSARPGAGPGPASSWSPASPPSCPSRA